MGGIDLPPACVSRSPERNLVKRTVDSLLWIVVAIAAAASLLWAFPAAYPLFPRGWEISGAEAEAIALERLRDLGELPADAYVVTVVNENEVLEHRLQSMLGSRSAEEIRRSRLGKNLINWEVTVYERDASSKDWSHQAKISPSGEVTQLRLRVPPEQEGGVIDAQRARREAEAFLVAQGFDLTLLGEPEVRTQQLQARTDLFLRYRDREALLGESYPYGVEVAFAGERLVGYSGYYDDPERAEVQREFQTLTLANQAWVFLALLLLPLVAIPFVRRYHAGEVGVRRGVQISVAIFALGLVMMLFCARAAAAGFQVGVLTRPQVTLVVAFQLLALFFFPMGLMAFLSWSVGESLCRERWTGKLAAFDALLKGDWNNSTFARSSLRGVTAGLVILAGLWSLSAALRGLGCWPSTCFFLGPWWESAEWFSVPLLAFAIAYSLYVGMFGHLLLVAAGVRATGRWLGPPLAAVGGALLFFPPIIVFPFAWSVPLWLLTAAAFVFLFLRYGLFTSLLAYVTLLVVSGSVPFLGASDPAIQFQATLALLVTASPLLVSFRSLASERQFVYRYEDVPPHVRRIAERERQRVELETARGIQSSILPDLPPQLGGVRIAHSYLPATEVGGDFYDVMALEDGRLAVAVGDVAGHGVSSGLVMSLTKSALAVQVTFNPEVKAVFGTLNRLVYQSARKRLLATLCYALIDPVRREMLYASAGHLFPYRVTGEGEVLALESVSYPLGVREDIEVRARSARLRAGDYLFLFSDGVVEARAENSDELFGFDRLEASLRRHGGAGVTPLRDGVLADLERFTRGSQREDDLTVLVLQIP